MTTEIKHSHVLYRKGNVSLVREQATLPGGSAMETIVIRHPGASAILPFLNSTTIVLIRQYRQAIGDYLVDPEKHVFRIVELRSSSLTTKAVAVQTTVAE